jgi:hypothetical protein
VFGPLELREQASHELGILTCAVLVTILRLGKPLFTLDSLSLDAVLLVSAMSLRQNLQLANSLPLTASVGFPTAATLPEFIRQWTRKRRAVETISLLSADDDDDDDDLGQPPQKRHEHMQTTRQKNSLRTRTQTRLRHDDEDNQVDDSDEDDDYLINDGTESENDDDTEVKEEDVRKKPNYTSAPRHQLPLHPLEMTGEVACPYGCPRVSKTVIAALTHKVSCSAKKSAFPADCPWRGIAGCKTRLTSQQSMSNHMIKHIRDTRGTFVCRGGCGNHYADIYSMVSHEQKCQLIESKPAVKRRKNQPLEFLILLNTIDKPSVIYVARSSAQCPPDA